MTKYKVDYKIKNKLSPVPLDYVRLGGYVGKLFDTFFQGRVLSEYAQNVVYKEAEDAFLHQVDDENISAIWQGEYWGKWMISAARVARYTHSEKLRSFIRRGAERMLGYQRADGYLGTYKNSAYFKMPTPEEAGTDAIGERYNWNIWCRKYTLWGMLECYMLLEDEKLLRSSVRMADQLISDLERTDTDITETGMFSGIASCSILKPLLILYRLTADKKYLEFATSFVSKWEEPENMPGLVANSISGRRVSEWFPECEIWAKAYETMSCFDGIVELYRITGNEKYLNASKAFFDAIVKHESNLLFSVGFNDHFCDAAYDLNCSSEPCDVIHYMRLAYELFLLTGDAEYMDRFELAASTPLLASAFKDGLWGARALRGQGRHQVARMQAKLSHNHCCVNNMPRGLLNMAEASLMTDGEALYINLYNELEAEITVGATRVCVQVTGDYLASSEASVSLRFNGAPVPVKLHIPSYSKYSEVELGGTVREVGAGYFTVLPTLESAKITVRFDNSVELLNVSSENERGNIAWKINHWVCNSFGTAGASVDYVSSDPDLYISGKATVLRKGAILLCRSKLIGSTEEEMFGERRLDGSYKCIDCQRIHTTENVNIELMLTFSNGKDTLKYHVADYASATNIMTEDKRLFSIYF